MTIVFLQPDGVPITAQAARQGNAAVYGGGAGRPLGGRSGFRVDTPSTILSATSTTWTLLPCSAMIDPGASTHQGMYGWASDANVTGSVTASNATFARKDIVYIQVNDSSAGDGSGAKTANVLYLAGTASATPVAPTLPARSFLVGTIDVPKTGAGSPTVTLNPARFVASGGVLPVRSQAERDALTPYAGLTITRLDLSGAPVERHDGSEWKRMGALAYRWNRNAGSDNTFTSANTNLVNGTITAAPAGLWRFEGFLGLYGSPSAGGRTFVGVGAVPVYEKRRQDLTGTPSTYYVNTTYTHTGGDLVLVTGFDVTTGTASVMAGGSGDSSLIATFLGN